MWSGQELVDWMALSRVHNGAVVRSRGDYLDGGAPIPRYLLPELLYDVLLRVGLITLGRLDHLGRETVSLTEAGQTRHEQLGHRGGPGGGHPVMVDDGDVRFPQDAGVLDDLGADSHVAGARDVRLPASSVEPVAGLTCASRVDRLSDHDADRGRSARQRGSILQPEGTSLPVRIPGTHLHPRLRRPASWVAPSTRAGSQA